MTRSRLSRLYVLRQPWWRHQMETFSALQAIFVGNSPVTGEFPSQRPVTRRFDIFFDLRLNKHLGKQSLGWWFETSSCSLWRHCNDSKWQDSNGICGSKSGLGKGGQEEPFKHHEFQYQDYLMTLSDGNIFRVTGPLWGELPGHRWVFLTKASDAELWCFLWSAPEQTVE